MVVVGLGMRVWAYWTLRGAGMPVEQWYVPERPKALVRRGPYRWLRHPAYVGSLLWFAGAGVACLGWGGAVVALPAWPFFALRMYQERPL